MNYNFDFKDKSVVITGGAGGIGLECARAFLQSGAVVYVADYIKDNLDAAEEILKKEFPEGKAIYIQADITDKEQVKNIIRTVKENTGSADILVNNAGIGRTVYSIKETAEDWARVLDINLTAQFFMSQEFACEFFIPSKKGKIVNMCSLGGIMGIPASAAYSASKGALMQTTKTLACEWARFGIQVNAVCPGFVDTPLIADNTANEKWLGYMTMRTPAGRLAVPEDVAGAVLFLSSHMADFITGTSLIIDGGFSSGS